MVRGAGRGSPTDIYGTAVGVRYEVLDRLREATTEVRADVLQRSLGDHEPVRPEVLDALEHARSARARLNAALLEGIERVTTRWIWLVPS
ncbi:MAG: hypothetical protein JWO67_7029 [Streptosporangiaceae bacterium]|nr:hypothetical protein [Streptosporangiaceae bacterium]